MPKKIHGRNLQAAINKSRTDPRKNTRADLLLFSVLLSTLMKIFLSRRHPAPDMPLGFVSVKHLSGFTGKGRVDLEEPFGDILMCSRYDFELFYFQQIHLRSILFHPAPDLPEVSGKYPRFRPCPPRSSE